MIQNKRHVEVSCILLMSKILAWTLAPPPPTPISKAITRVPSPTSSRLVERPPYKWSLASCRRSSRAWALLSRLSWATYSERLTCPGSCALLDWGKPVRSCPTLDARSFGRRSPIWDRKLRTEQLEWRREKQGTEIILPIRRFELGHFVSFSWNPLEWQFRICPPRKEGGAKSRHNTVIIT